MNPPTGPQELTVNDVQPIQHNAADEGSTTGDAVPDRQQVVQISIAEIESSLPHRRGEEASLGDYLAMENDYNDALSSFYNDGKDTFKKFTGLMKKAREAEYHKLADGLL
ncbi:hypothetical protein BGZ58_003534, partial [Dissophora ornata]